VLQVSAGSDDDGPMIDLFERAAWALSRSHVAFAAVSLVLLAALLLVIAAQRV
jgi:hypothetical protein